MEIRVLTLFPDLMDAVVLSSITGRAVNEGLIGYRAVDIRDYAGNKYGKVDDSVYGGGKGMLMMCGPVYDSWLSAKSSFDSESDPITIYMSPKGKVFDQKKAIELSQKENIIFLCGHYEGIDQRVLDVIVDEEISIGDYVLTGGEIAACAVIDATARLVPGVLPGEEAYSDESHMRYGLEHPQFTKPAIWNGVGVPEVLTSGHHKNIEEWKYLASLYETMIRRPDLFEKMEISQENLYRLINDYMK
ncbi:tRNA (guanosine(37)-N1)-methyltransferase TrmD [Candidatus Nomurabacteria bacterium]|nr:tRNA (guanosine(37)-N1)-methyltransferase TrmD [Candidatus Nomurabacteria bacterium]